MAPLLLDDAVVVRLSEPPDDPDCEGDEGSEEQERAEVSITASPEDTIRATDASVRQGTEAADSEANPTNNITKLEMTR